MGDEDHHPLGLWEANLKPTQLPAREALYGSLCRRAGISGTKQNGHYIAKEQTMEYNMYVNESLYVYTHIHVM